MDGDRVRAGSVSAFGLVTGVLMADGDAVRYTLANVEVEVIPEMVVVLASTVASLVELHAGLLGDDPVELWQRMVVAAEVADGRRDDG